MAIRPAFNICMKLDSLIPPVAYFSTTVYLRKKFVSEHQKLKSSMTHRALGQFDDIYKVVFEEQWPSIRVALLSPGKRAILVNNFGGKDRTVEILKLEGALSVRHVFLEKQQTIQNDGSIPVSEDREMIYKVGNKIDDIISRKQEEDVNILYPEGTDSAETILAGLVAGDNRSQNKPDNDEDTLRAPLDPTKDQPLAEGLRNADYDHSRIIAPSSSGIMLGASLYEFVPATKLMGMEDYVPESTHYKYFKEAAEAPIIIEDENNLNFPSNLEIFAFERGNCQLITSEMKKGSTGVYDFYALDLAYLAPILGLDLKSGDKVLDMTSLHEETTLLIAQTLVPRIFVSNCCNQRNATYMLQMLQDHVFNILEDESTVIVTDSHPLDIQDSLLYNKILLFVPSIDDRKTVTVEDSNPFHHTKTKSRLNLPEMQIKFLRKALELVEVGGSVVYCTRSLSPVQNEGVVQSALNQMWNNTNCKFVVRNLEQGLRPLHPFMKIANSDTFGHIILPFIPNNYGPLYFCKIVKTFQDVKENI